jgi:hypothetical protein
MRLGTTALAITVPSGEEEAHRETAVGRGEPLRDDLDAGGVVAPGEDPDTGLEGDPERHRVGLPEQDHEDPGEEERAPDHEAGPEPVGEDAPGGVRDDVADVVAGGEHAEPCERDAQVLAHGERCRPPGGAVDGGHRERRP